MIVFIPWFTRAVDGRNPANQLRLVVYPIIGSVLYIPGGCLGFLPSTVFTSCHHLVTPSLVALLKPGNSFDGGVM